MSSDQPQAQTQAESSSTADDVQPQSTSTSAMTTNKSKLNAIFANFEHESLVVKSKLKHVEPNVRHAMPEALEESLSTPFKVDYYHNSPRFDCNDPRAYRYLERHGYVIIRDAIAAQDIPKMKALMWDWLESLGKNDHHDNDVEDEDDESDADKRGKRPQMHIDRERVETWHTWPSGYTSGLSKGIVSRFGVGQTQFMWFARSQPNVIQTFANVWRTQDLIVSFDGCNFYRPWRYHAQWKTKSKWWHVDQNAARKESRGRQCVQGLISLMDADETTGGLCVIPKSHKEHQKICDRNPSHPGIDFVGIDKRDPIFEEYGTDGAIVVRCKAGDLCLWDSRTVHCNAPAIVPVLNPDTHEEWKHSAPYNSPEYRWDLIRMVCYVCMTPRSKARNSVLKLRQAIAFKMHATSTHWPHYFQHWLAGKVYVKHGSFELNARQRQLVGCPRTFWEECQWQIRRGAADLLAHQRQACALTTVAALIGFTAYTLWKNWKKTTKTNTTNTAASLSRSQ